jgi:DNA-binding NarL/FixJ family response regulator
MLSSAGPARRLPGRPGSADWWMRDADWWTGDGRVEALKQLRRTGPAVRVLVLTTYDTDSDVLPAIEAGATGYLLKDAPREELILAVRAAFAGEAVLSRRSPRS